MRLETGIESEVRGQVKGAVVVGVVSVADISHGRLRGDGGDSEACRSAFRTDVDHDSEVMPIGIPN
jgi:hypothetical protein